MPPAVAIAIVVMVLIAAITRYLRSYRPHRVPVVERARVPRDVRAKVSTKAMSRGLHRKRRFGWHRYPASASATDVQERRKDVEDVQKRHKDVEDVQERRKNVEDRRKNVEDRRKNVEERRKDGADVEGIEEITAPVTSVATAPPAPRATARTLVQPVLAHNLAGASRPGSYFRSVDAPSPETIVSGERGPWAAPIVTEDGRITLPDSGKARP